MKETFDFEAWKAINLAECDPSVWYAVARKFSVGRPLCLKAPAGHKGELCLYYFTAAGMQVESSPFCGEFSEFEARVREIFFSGNYRYSWAAARAAKRLSGRVYRKSLKSQ